MGNRKESFAERLRSIREEMGISQYRLAQLTGITKQAISQLELSQSQPSWDTVQALARGLGIDVNRFVLESADATDQPDKTPPPRPRGRPRKDEGV